MTFLNYPEWNVRVPYKVGKKVRHKDMVWICNEDNTGIEPTISDFNADFNNDFGGASAGAWVLYNMTSDYVRNLTINGIHTAIQQFITQKQLTKETRNLMERRTFFDGAARLAATKWPGIAMPQRCVPAPPRIQRRQTLKRRSEYTGKGQ